VERPALTAAVGYVSAAVALAALSGMLDAPILFIAILCVGVRACAAALAGAPLAGAPLALSRAASAAIPLAALATVATWRSGAGALDAIRGANSVLGPAAITRPAAIAIATLLAAVAAIAAAASQAVALGDAHPLPRLLDRVGMLATVLLIVTAAGGPDVDDARSVLAWTVGSLLVLVGMRVAERIASHHRIATLAASVAGAAIVVGAFG
jgi:hypothetical protein